MRDSAIYTSELTKRFRGFVAVDAMTLSVDRGSIFGFLGLNGAGKTTMIRMLLGMMRPTSGEAYLFGDKIDVSSYSVWRRVGYLVETPHAYPELTVRQNLDIIAKLRGLKDRHAADQIMEKLSLTPYAQRKAGHLSLGNSQRLGLAKALIHSPDLLILDEPTNGLDPAGIVEIRALLRDLARDEGVTIFTSSHLLEEVSKLATNIGIIHQGKLLQEISSETLQGLTSRQLLIETLDNTKARTQLAKAGYKAKETDGVLRLQDTDALTHPEVIATKLVDMGVPPTRLTIESESLETYFLRVIGDQPQKGDDK